MIKRIKDFFGLSRIPFSKNLKPKELFQSFSFLEAFSRLSLALQTEEICLLIGSVGTGKTNVIRYFVDKLDEHSYLPIYIPSDKYKISEIARLALNEMKWEVPFYGPAALRQFKEAVVVLNRNKGIKPILILDEAHELPLSTLSALKGLINYEMDSVSYLFILLSGQKELQEILQMSKLEALRRRIRISYLLEGLSLEETCQYIKHHLRLCGLEKNIFTDDIMAEIFKQSKGVLSEIDRLSYELLLLAVSTERELIEPSMLNDINLS